LPSSGCAPSCSASACPCRCSAAECLCLDPQKAGAIPLAAARRLSAAASARGWWLAKVVSHVTDEERKHTIVEYDENYKRTPQRNDVKDIYFISNLYCKLIKWNIT
jgi:hypothetical protein